MKLSIFNSFQGYKLPDLLRDIMSGILVAIIALPLSIAIGIQSGATLQQGIITAIIAGLLVSLFGGCRVQIGGPSGAFVAITAGYIASIGMLGLHVATIMAGIIMIFLGIFRIGALIKYMPYPIVIGFTTGLGLTLLLGQISDFTGIVTTADFNIFSSSSSIFYSDFINKLTNLSTNITSLNIATLCIGALTITLMVVLSKISKKIPSAFIAILVATGVTLILGIYSETSFGVATIGSVYPNIQPEISLPDWQSFASLDLLKLIIPSFVIAFLASMESLLSATVSDNLTSSKHDSNAELFGQGIANITSSCLGGLPATGAIARTATNIQNGGTTPIAGITHSLVLLLMFFVLMPLLKFVPMACLGAVLVMVSIQMAKLKLCVSLTTFNVRDTVILLVTLFLTVYKDLIYGVIGGIVITLLIMCMDVFSHHDIYTLEGIQVSDIHNQEQTTIAVVSPTANLTFISGTKLVEHIERISITSKHIILDLCNVNRVDVSAVEKVAKLERNLLKNNIKFNIINDNKYISKQLQKMRKL